MKTPSTPSLRTPTEEPSPEPSVVRRTAPEDLQPGQYIVVLERDVPMLVGSCDSVPGAAPYGRTFRPDRVIVPAWDPEPLKVVAVCLPFVLVRDAERSVSTVDLRATRVGWLSRAYAREARRELRRTMARMRGELTDLLGTGSSKNKKKGKKKGGKKKSGKKTGKKKGARDRRAKGKGREHARARRRKRARRRRDR